MASPIIYVIVDLAKENQSIQDQCKGTKFSGKDYDEVNFKVSQWLQMALANGSALVLWRSMMGMVGQVIRNYW